MANKLHRLNGCLHHFHHMRLVAPQWKIAMCDDVGAGIAFETCLFAATLILGTDLVFGTWMLREEVCETPLHLMDC